LTDIWARGYEGEAEDSYGVEGNIPVPWGHVWIGWMFLIYSAARKKSEVACRVLMTEMYQQIIPLRVGRPEETRTWIPKDQKANRKQYYRILWFYGYG